VFPYKERYLERLFYKEAGTIPYRFICLVKFNYVIIELQAGDFRSFNQFLQNYNYHDHFHFEKDFEIKIGQSIKSYNHEFNPLLTKGLARVYNKLPKIE
jgi:AraC-like DNA-binding protein